MINQIDFLLDLLDCFFTFSIFYWTLDGELHALNFRVPSWLQLTLAHLHALAGHGDVSGCAIGATGASSGFDTGAAGAGGAGGAPMSIDELRAELRRDPNSGIQCLRGQVWRLSRDANGCRVVQEALELGSRDVTDLANELQGHVLEAVMCPYANYVVQKVVSHLSVATSSFVATAPGQRRACS